MDNLSTRHVPPIVRLTVKLYFVPTDKYAPVMGEETAGALGNRCGSIDIKNVKVRFVCLV